jgi:hypothetical protein
MGGQAVQQLWDLTRNQVRPVVRLLGAFELEHHSGRRGFRVEDGWLGTSKENSDRNRKIV